MMCCVAEWSLPLKLRQISYFIMHQQEHRHTHIHACAAESDRGGVLGGVGVYPILSKALYHWLDFLEGEVTWRRTVALPAPEITFCCGDCSSRSRLYLGNRSFLWLQCASYKKDLWRHKYERSHATNIFWSAVWRLGRMRWTAHGSTLKLLGFHSWEINLTNALHPYQAMIISGNIWHGKDTINPRENHAFQSTGINCFTRYVCKM